MMRRFLCFLAISMLAFSLAACNASADRSHGGNAVVSPEESRNIPVDPVAQAAPPSAQDADTHADEMPPDTADAGLQISVRSGGNITVFALNGSKAAEALYAQLPLTVELEDYGSNEKIFYPPGRLDVAGTPLAAGDAQAGTLAYYEPWGDVVLFYDSFGPASGLYELGGAVLGVEQIAAMSGVVEIAPYRGDNPVEQNGKTLLVYFSHTGNTGVAAEQIRQATGADVFEIVPVTPYPVDYSENLAVARSELDQDARPSIEGQSFSLDGYDTILLGYPVWHGTIPMPVATFLEAQDFTGKRIAPFCTSGSTSISRSEAQIAVLAPDAVVLPGLGITGNTLANAEALVAQWLRDLGIS